MINSYSTRTPEVIKMMMMRKMKSLVRRKRRRMRKISLSVNPLLDPDLLRRGILLKYLGL
jgi:hypothetical protein